MAIIFDRLFNYILLRSYAVTLFQVAILVVVIFGTTVAFVEFPFPRGIIKEVF
jgi:ABC-type microcin C transport system permease subunit YejB